MDRTNRTDNLARDAAGIGPHARPGVRLRALRELDGFDVAQGEADVRGWEVRTVGGRELGKVNDLLIDADAGEVVMLDIDLHGTDRHTLAPVRAAQLDRTRRTVIIDSADLQNADAVPSLRRDAAPSDDEGREFHERYQKAYGERGWGRDHDWRIERNDHDLEFRRRDQELDRTHAAGIGGGLAALGDSTRRDTHDVDAEQRDRMLAEQTRRDAERREAQREQAEEAAERQRRESERLREEAERQRRESAQRAGGTAGTTDADPARRRELRWAQGQQDEVVVERRPVIEEVIIRRRVVDPGSVDAQGSRDAGGEAR